MRTYLSIVAVVACMYPSRVAASVYGDESDEIEQMPEDCCADVNCMHGKFSMYCGVVGGQDTYDDQVDQACCDIPGCNNNCENDADDYEIERVAADCCDDANCNNNCGANGNADGRVAGEAGVTTGGLLMVAGGAFAVVVAILYAMLHQVGLL